MPEATESFTVTSFIAELEVFREEIGCNGTGTAVHDQKSSVMFRTPDGKIYTANQFELKRKAPCRCPVGVIVELKELSRYLG